MTWGAGGPEAGAVYELLELLEYRAMPRPTPREETSCLHCLDADWVDAEYLALEIRSSAGAAGVRTPNQKLPVHDGGLPRGRDPRRAPCIHRANCRIH